MLTLRAILWALGVGFIGTQMLEDISADQSNSNGIKNKTETWV